MCGLAINIATFSHLLKKVDFDAVVDHLAITHIMKSKMRERIIEINPMKIFRNIRTKQSIPQVLKILEYIDKKLTGNGN